MSSHDWHPDSEALFRACLGELQPGEAGTVETHLAACPQCRTALDEIRGTMAEFTDFYQSDYKSRVPAPPRNWQAFHAALQGAASRPGWRERLGSFFAGRRLVPAAVTAGVAALALVAVLRLQHAPAASASELLARAEAFQQRQFASVGHATVFQKLEVRVGTKTLTRTVYRAVGRHRQVDRWSEPKNATAPAEAQPALAAELEQDFREARLDWDDPLSPIGIRTWFMSHAGEKQDEQSVRRDDGHFTLRSTAENEPVTQADFVLRASDYHPVSARLHFRGRSADVHLTELAYEVRSLDTLDPATRAELAEPQMPETAVSAAPKASAPAPDLNEIELEAWYALRRHDADLGGEAQVQRTGAGIAVKGLVASEQRREELRAALSHVPGVRVDLQTVAEAARQQSGALASAVEVEQRPPGGRAALQQLLAARFPEQQSRDSFVLGTLEASQNALARGFALERLANRYPAAVEAELSPEGRTRLRSMVAEHHSALKRYAATLFERLDSLVGPVAPEPPAQARSGWQEQQKQLLPDLKRVDKIVMALVSDSGMESVGTEELISEYRECVTRIRAVLQQPAGGEQ